LKDVNFFFIFILKIVFRPEVRVFFCDQKNFFTLHYILHQKIKIFSFIIHKVLTAPAPFTSCTNHNPNKFWCMLRASYWLWRGYKYGPLVGILPGGTEKFPGSVSE